MPEIDLYGTRWHADTNHARKHLEFLNVPYRYVDIDDDEGAARRVEDWNRGDRTIPTIVLDAAGEETVLANPSEAELHEQLAVRGLLPIAAGEEESSPG